MAGSSAVRLRLQFDYPPPSGPQCRMSWILLDLNRCRVIADLCSEIRDRFGYSSRTELDLFIEESYLPPSESIYLIRDNDSIRVKVSSPSCASSSGSVKRGNKGNKRSRDEEDGEAVIQVKKSKSEEAQANGTSKAEEVKKKKKKKRNKKQSQAATEPTQEPLSSKAESEKSSKKASGSSVSTTDKVSKTNRKHNESSASSESSKETSQKPKPKTKPSKAKESSSSEDEAPSKPGKPNVTVPAKKSLPITPKPTNSKPTARPIQTTTSKAKESTSSECSSSSSEDDATPSKPSKPNLTLKPSKPTTSTNSKTSATKNSTQSSSDSSSPSPPAKKTAPPTAVQNGPASAVSTPVVKMNEKKPEKTDSDSSSEIELVIKTPNPQVLGMTPLWGGKARGRGGVRGGFGRARGTPWKQNYHFNYDSGEQQKQDDAQTNKSLVLENPPELKRDYSTLPLLAAPPAVGQKIAFKLLELTENYTPEVSDYKEAKIVGFNHTTNMIALELLTRAQARVEPGKFDLVYQNPDGSESVEYAVTVGSQLTERWDSLLEPRLIVENSG